MGTPREGIPAAGLERLRTVVVFDPELDDPSAEGFRAGLLWVISVNDASVAIELVHSFESVDVAVFDIDGNDGVGLTAIEQCHAIRPQLPLLGASADLFSAGKAILAGAVGFVQKPYSFDDLQSPVLSVLKD